MIREYDRSLPRMVAYPAELNLVWTNLIDNAIDAMDGCGTLTVRTRASGDRLAVEIGNTGLGIPTWIRSRIFERFFTTEDIGKGTSWGSTSRGGSSSANPRPETPFHRRSSRRPARGRGVRRPSEPLHVGE